MGNTKRPKQKKIPTDKKLLPDKGKGGMNQEIQRRALVTPGPWSYDLKVKWMKGSGKEQVEGVEKTKKQMFYKWKQTPPEQREFSQPKKTKQKKLNPEEVQLFFVTLRSQKSRNIPILILYSSKIPRKNIRFLDLAPIFWMTS